MGLTLTSPAFADGETIPLRYTGDGEDVSPPLAWSGVPEGTVSWALVCEDLDAPGGDPWVHWILYDVPPETRALPEAIPPVAEPEQPPCRQGVNSWGNVGYGGPYPPAGDGPHRYRFTLYALRAKPDLPPAPDREALLRAIGGLAMARAQLTGVYQR